MAHQGSDTLSTLQAKYDALRAQLESLAGVVVAFSGGIDSTLLLKVAHDVLGPAAIAATVRSVFFPQRELDDAVDFCTEEGIEHIVVDFDPLAVDGIAENPPDRCYRCKKALFEHLVRLARQRGISTVAEGSNVDDLGDYRPGARAIEELGVASPLLACGFGKDDIRLLAMSLGIDTWDKPSAACLASRFAFGETLTPARLAMVDQAEQLVRKGDFEQVRVRVHGDIARIEVPRAELADLVEYDERTGLSEKLRSLGFTFVTADLGGFRSGSMNQTL